MPRFPSALSASLLRRDVCSGCHDHLGPLCSQCQDALTSTQPGLLSEVFAISHAGTYAPPLSNVIIAFKDRGQWILRPYLAGLLARSLAHLVLTSSSTPADHPLLVVPIPSSAAAVRHRNSDVIAELAGSATAILRTAGLNVVTRKLLRMRGHHRDQLGLTRRERKQNMVDAFFVEPAHCSSADVILVDDVVTTGATLHAAYTALIHRGLIVHGAAVLASSPSNR